MLDSFVSAVGNHGCSAINAISGQFAHRFCGSSVESGARGVLWLHPRGIGIAACVLAVIAIWGAVNGAVAIGGALKNRKPAGDKA